MSEWGGRRIQPHTEEGERVSKKGRLPFLETLSVCVNVQSEEARRELRQACQWLDDRGKEGRGGGGGCISMTANSELGGREELTEGRKGGISMTAIVS